MDDLFSETTQNNLQSSRYDDFDNDDEEITQNDAWVVISKYFDEKGLVRQQLDSFDEFIENTMQELIDDSGEIRVTPEDQFIPGQVVEQFTYIVKFEQVYVGAPVIYETDGEMRDLYPHEARLRSLTYAAPIYIGVTCKQYQIDAEKKFNPDDTPVKTRTIDYEGLGFLPIMLRCRYCRLNNRKDIDLTHVGECVFDQGGYFVINGSEKECFLTPADKEAVDPIIIEQEYNHTF